MALDLKEFRPGRIAIIEDGRRGIISGLYLSDRGPILRLKLNTESIIEQNVPIWTVLEVVDA